MPSTIKFTLLALASTAAAAPHYSHSRFHRPSGGYGPANPYPTGGWGRPSNSTAMPFPTGSGVADDKTTTIDQTLTSTQTVVKTIYATRPGDESPSSVVAVDVSTGAGQCGPETVYVTATNRVTVTVPAGGAPSSVNAPSSAVEASSSAMEVPSAAEPSSSAVLSSATPIVEAPSSSMKSSANYGGQQPSATPTNEGIYSILPVVSDTPSPLQNKDQEPSPAASSATQKPTHVASTGGKRGLAYNKAELCGTFSSKVSWAYNWAEREGQTLPNGIDYTPLCHRASLYPGEEGKEKWLSAVSDAAKAGSTAVMGFNEPDHWQQANMSPDQACTEWKRLMNPVKDAHGDITVVGPSVTNGEKSPFGSVMGLGWLQKFHEACPDVSYDATNIHFYSQADDQTLERFIAHIEKAHEMFGKPVWVTEFGLNEGSSEQAAQSFLKGAMEYMDGSDKVARYAYFMVGTGPNQLNVASGLSALGNLYNS